MKTIFKTWLGICLSASVLMLPGCGGGGEPVAGVGSGGTGSNRSYVAGLVTKSDGELVVNGVHIETEGAQVSESSAPEQTLAPAAIKPGMMVEVDASSIRNIGGKQVAKAERIEIASQITGQVWGIGNEPYELPEWLKNLLSAIRKAEDADESEEATAALAASAPENPDAIQEAMTDEVPVEDEKILYVLGIKVVVRPETRFDENLPDGFNSVKRLDKQEVLEVHGFFDAQSFSIIATRIQKKPSKIFTVQGKFANLNALDSSSQLDAWTVILKALPEIFKNLTTGLENLIKNGRIVQIKFSPEQLKMEPGADLPSISVIERRWQSADKLDAVVDGLVTHIHDEAGQRISINNVDIDIAGVIVRCEDGITVCPAPRLSDRLRVRGEMVKEKLIAKEVVVLETLDDLAP